MPTVSGVTFDGKKGGKLEEPRIPNEDYESHYLYPGDTKSESSYPQVDADNNLRRGNVKAAWSLGARGGVDGEEHDRKVKRLGRQFDSNPLPDDAYEQDNMQSFSQYSYSEGDWIERNWSGGSVYGKVRNTSENCMTADGNEVCPDDGGIVVKFEEYDESAGEFTGQMIVAKPNSLSSWDGPSQDNSLEIDEDLAFGATALEGEEAKTFERDGVGGNFNAYGVRENVEGGNLMSVDVVFEAMEPGPPEDRNGVRITEDFLRDVAEKDYDNPPHLVDHRREDSFAKVGDVRDVWFSESRGKLMLQARVPNTGTETHDDAIKRYTHEPPSWREGSVGFGRQYEAVENNDGEPELVDAALREFSAVNFPGGYDDGGLRPAFAEAAQEAAGGLDVQTLEGRLLEKDFDSDASELDEVYFDWSNEVNMTASQLESWADHACADEASLDPEAVRERNMNLLEKDKSEWGMSEIDDAKRTISFISRMRGQRPDSPASGGTGTCPSEWAISLLNWAYNPFDGMPDGTPEPQDNSLSIMKETIEFAEYDSESGEMERDRSSMEMEEKSEIYDAYENLVNMDETDMDVWSMHPCSDKMHENAEDHRDNFYMLHGQPMEEWDDENFQIANRMVAFANESMENVPDDPSTGGPGTCPSRWAIRLLNRGHNPFDGFPGGNPYFGEIDEAFVSFNDPDNNATGEKLATDDGRISVDKEQFTF